MGRGLRVEGRVTVRDRVGGRIRAMGRLKVRVTNRVRLKVRVRGRVGASASLRLGLGLRARVTAWVRVGEVSCSRRASPSPQARRQRAEYLPRRGAQSRHATRSSVWARRRGRSPTFVTLGGRSLGWRVWRVPRRVWRACRRRRVWSGPRHKCPVWPVRRVWLGRQRAAVGFQGLWTPGLGS